MNAIKTLIYSFIVIAVVLVLTVVTAAVFKLNVPVTGLAKTAAAIVTVSSNKEISITGNISIVPGRWTDLRFENSEITVNDPQMGKVAGSVTYANLRINLRSLLEKHLEISTLAVNTLTLEILHERAETPTNPHSKQYDFSTLQQHIRRVKEISGVAVHNFNLFITEKDRNSPSVFQLDSINGFAGQEIPGELHVAGSIQTDKIGVNLKIDPLGNITCDNRLLKYTADVRYLGADLSFTGDLTLSKSGFQTGSDFNLKNLSVSQLASLAGKGKKSEKEDETLFSCSGRLTASPENMGVVVTSFSPGTTNLNASFTLQKPVAGKPPIIASIAAELIDIDRLGSTLIPGRGLKTNGPSKPEDRSIRKDSIIFPEILARRSFELQLDVDKLLVAGKQITGLHTHTVMRDGVIKDAPITALFEHFSIQGRLGLDAAGEHPKLQLHYATKFWDLGRTLKDFGLAEDIDATIAESSFAGRTFGRTLNELLKNLDFTVEGSSALLQLPDRNTGAVLPVTINSFTLQGQPPKGANLEFNGSIGGNQIKASAVIANRTGGSPDSMESVPFRMTVEQKDTRLKLEGAAPLPFHFTGTTVSYDFSGSNIQSLEKIVKHELPITGGYRATGTVQIIDEGYRFDDLELELGRSFFEGGLQLNTKSTRPKLSVELVAEKLQLADFKKGLGGSGATATNDKFPGSAGDKSRQESRQDLTWSVPSNFDADITLRLKELASGEDKLGSGTIQLELDSGKMSLTPITVKLAAGEIDARFFMTPLDNNMVYALDVDVDNLDYGVVSRWFKPGTDQAGILDLRTAINGSISASEPLLSHAEGYIDFYLQPKNLRTGVIDLWAINLVSYLLPIFMPTPDSQLNCIGGRFNLNNGKLQQEDFLADTSRIQIKGSIDVDFARRWIEARLRPIPKRPQFYSLATPVQVSGRLDNLKLGVAKGGLIGTMIRILTSYVAVPVQWAARQKVPVDATSQCVEIYNGRQLSEN